MGADYSRVTHPCAALLRAEAPFTLDLHVLGLPPAFVLSQDQTLQFDLVYIDLLSRDVPWNVFTQACPLLLLETFHRTSLRDQPHRLSLFLGSHFCLFLSLLRFSNHRGPIFEPVNEKRLIRALRETVKLFFQKNSDFFPSIAIYLYWKLAQGLLT